MTRFYHKRQESVVMGILDAFGSLASALLAGIVMLAFACSEITTNSLVVRI